MQRGLQECASTAVVSFDAMSITPLSFSAMKTPGNMRGPAVGDMEMECSFDYYCSHTSQIKRIYA